MEFKKFTLRAVVAGLFFTFTLSNMTLEAQVPQYVSPDGLLAWYPFGGNTEDATSNNLDLQNLGCEPAADRFGNANSAYAFDGEATYMRRNDFPFPESENSSVSVWFRRTDPTSAGHGVVISRGDEATQPGTWFVRSGGQGAPPNHTTGRSWLSSGLSIIGGEATGEDWEHILFVRSSENFGRFYINGVLAEEDDIDDVMVGGVDFLVGAQPGPNSYHDGLIDDIGVWSTALTACDAKKLFLTYEYTQPESASAAPGESVTFSTTDSDDVSFQWQVNSGTGWQDITNFGQYSGANSHQLTVADLTEGNNNFAFRCIIDYDGVCEDITDEVTLTVTTTGLFDQPEVNVLNIFPNPNTGKFQLDLGNGDFSPKANVTVFDITGKIIFNELAGNLQPTIDLSSLPQGMYLLKVTEDNKVGSARISISK